MYGWATGIHGPMRFDGLDHFGRREIHRSTFGSSDGSGQRFFSCHLGRYCDDLTAWYLDKHPYSAELWQGFVLGMERSSEQADGFQPSTLAIKYRSPKLPLCIHKGKL